MPREAHTGYTLTGKKSKSNRDCSFWSSSVGKNRGHVERVPKGSLFWSNESDTKRGGISAWEGNERGSVETLPEKSPVTS